MKPTDNDPNPEPLHSWIEPELEARLTALVLGEASDFEREELEREIADRPELGAYRKRLEEMHRMLTRIGKGEPDVSDDSWKLSGERRAVLDLVFDGEEVTESVVEGEEEPDIESEESVFAEDTRGRRFGLVFQIAALVMGMAIVGALILSGSGGIMKKERDLMTVSDGMSPVNEMRESYFRFSSEPNGSSPAFPVTPATPVTVDSNGNPMDFNPPEVAFEKAGVGGASDDLHTSFHIVPQQKSAGESLAAIQNLSSLGASGPNAEDPSGPNVNLPDEGNTHSLFQREFRGGAEKLRGFDLANLAPVEEVDTNISSDGKYIGHGGSPLDDVEKSDVTAGSVVDDSNGASDRRFARSENGTWIAVGRDAESVGQAIANEGKIGSLDGTVALGAGGDILLKSGNESEIEILSRKPESRNAGSGERENGELIVGAASELKSRGNIHALAIDNAGASSEDGNIQIVTDEAGILTGTIAAQGSGGAVTVESQHVRLSEKMETDASIDGDLATNQSDGGTVTLHAGREIVLPGLKDQAGGERILAEGTGIRNGGTPRGGMVTWSLEAVSSEGAISESEGERLSVTSQDAVGTEDFAINLDGEPEKVEFDGFINYGSPITAGRDQNETSQKEEGNILGDSGMERLGGKRPEIEAGLSAGGGAESENEVYLRRQMSVPDSEDQPEIPAAASRYVTRLQENVMKADEAALRGSQLLADGDLEGAVSEFSAANARLPDAPITEDRKRAYTEQFAAASTRLARKMADEAEYEQATELLRDVLAPGVDPSNPEAKELLKRLNDPEYYSPALTPKHLENRKKVESALNSAQSYAEIGDFDRAEKEYDKVLNEDPYNSAARRGMETLENERMDYYEVARNNTRAEFIKRVSEGWELPVPAPIAANESEKDSQDPGDSKISDSKPDRMGSFSEAQHEWRNYPGHPASTNIQPAMTEIMELVPQVVGGGAVATDAKNSDAKKSLEASNRDSSDKATIRWDSFSVAAGENTNFQQPQTNTDERRQGLAVELPALARDGVSLEYGIPVKPEKFGQVGGQFYYSTGYEFKSGDNNLEIGREGEERSEIEDQEGSIETPRLAYINESMGGRAEDGDIPNHQGHGQVVPIQIDGQNEGGPVRNFNEGMGLTPIGTNPVTAGLRSGAMALDGDSIDRLILEAAGATSVEDIASPKVFGIAGVFTDPQFQVMIRGLKQENGEPAVIGSQFGDTEVAAGLNSFSSGGAIQTDNGLTQFAFVPPGQSTVDLDGNARTKDRVLRAVRELVPIPQGIDEKKAAAEPFSTFSLHVSDVSFKLAQASLAKGEWPDAERIRIEEFVNAFDYGDPMPNQADKVACRVEQAIHPFLQQRNLMRVSMRTAEIGRAASTPLRLTLLLDNSGSMERADRRETVKRALSLLASQLQPQDQVTLIGFARQPRLLADAVSGDSAKELVSTVANLPSEGGTNLEDALRLAFEKAREHYEANAQNRIVLLTDGAANLGDAEPENLAKIIDEMREAEVAFDAAGIGAEGLNDEILEALTRKGDGRYYLLDRPEDADSGFARQIAGALRPAAKNVKIQVEFNPERVGNYKLIGFEKHRLKKEDFRNDAVDAAEMAAAEAGVAVYQFEPRADGDGDVGSVSVRFRDMNSGKMIEKRWPIPYEANPARPEQAAPSLQVATIASQLGARLKGGPLGDVVELDDLVVLVAALPERELQRERVKQLREMISKARQLEGEQ